MRSRIDDDDYAKQDHLWVIRDSKFIAARADLAAIMNTQ